MATPLTRGFVAVHPEALRYRGRRGGGLFKTLLRTALLAVLYALFLHLAVVLGLMAYAITQEGFPGVVPTLSHGGDAYIGAWLSVVSAWK